VPAASGRETTPSADGSAAPAARPDASAREAPRLSSQEPVEYDAQTQTLIARGNARLADGQLTLEADEIRFNRAEQTARATGNVRILFGEVLVLSETVTYDASARRFQSGRLRLGTPPVYLEGESARGNAEEIIITEGRAYYGEPDPYAPGLTAREIILRPGETLQIDDALVRLGDVPVLPLPHYQQSIREGRAPLDITLDAGFRDNLGGYLQSELLLQTPYDLYVGGLLDVYTERGVLLGPAGDYDVDSPDGQARGWLKFGWIDDQGGLDERGTGLLGEPVPESRYFLEWEHIQTWREDVDLIANLSWWSDSEVLRDFREDIFLEDQQPDNFGQATWRRQNSFFSVFLRAQPNDFYEVQQRLPEIRWDLMPMALPHGLYQQAQASWAYLKEDPLTSADSPLESNRLDAYYGLSRPWRVREWLTLTPVVGARVTHYADATGSDGQFTRLLGEAGFDAEMTFHGLWDVQNDFWEIDGLRHLVRPVLRYRYIPEAGQGRGRIPMIDREVFSTFLEPVSLANRRDIDDLFEENLVRLGVENLVQTRHPDFGARDLAYLNLYQDIRFSERPEENDYSDLHALAGLSPAYWLDLNVYSRFDPEFLTLQEFRTGVTLHNAGRWTARLSTNTLQNTTDQYFLDLSYKLNERNSLFGRWRLDARTEKLIEQIYAWRMSLGNSWDIRWEVAYRTGTRREGDLSFGFQVELLQF